MITYNRGQWIEDASIPDEYKYTSDKGLIYAGYEPISGWDVGLENVLQVKIHWPTDDLFDSISYRYFALIETFACADGVLIKDFLSLLMFLKEMVPLFQDAREQELYEMQEEEHQWRARDRRDDTGERNFCSHL